MDAPVAIEDNREALKRILTALVAMAGFALGGPFAASAPTLPRHLYLAVLRLLRPAEAAARRLVIALAGKLAATAQADKERLPAALPPAKLKLVPTHDVLRSLGIAVTVSSADSARKAAAPRTLSLSLTDPLRVTFHPRRRTVAAHACPRIRVPGFDGARHDPAPATAKPRPSLYDPVDATRLGLRLRALAAALDDLPKQARRFARWQARCDRALARGRRHRIWPLRPGRPPRGKLSRFDPTAKRRANIREVDEVLAHAHALAMFALERRDTS